MQVLSHKTTGRFALGFALAGMLAGSVKAADENLTLRLPADTMWAVTVRDVDDLKTAWKSSRFQAAWDSPELVPIREEFAKKWEELDKEIREDAGLSPFSLIDHFHGFAGIFSTMLESKSDGEETATAFDVCLVAETTAADQEEIRKVLDGLLAEIPTDATRSAEEFRDTRIYTIHYVDERAAEEAPKELEGLGLAAEVNVTLQYAFSDRYFIFSAGDNGPVRKTLESLSADSTSTLGGNNDFTVASREVGPLGDLCVWINLPNLMESFLQMSGDPNAEVAMKSLGVRDLGAYLGTMGLDDKGLYGRMAIALPAEHAGILAALDSGGELRMDSARKAPGDTLAYFAWTLDLAPVWQAIKSTLIQVEPSTEANINAGLTTARVNFGVDLEKDLIENIKGEHSLYRRPLSKEIKDRLPAEWVASAPAYSQSVLLSLENGTHVVEVLNAFFTKLKDEMQMPLEQLTQRGFNIWTAREDSAAGPPVRPALALTNTHIVFSNNIDEMQEALRLLTGEATQTLAETDGFKEAMSSVDKTHLRLFSYSSPDAMGNSAEELRSVLELLGKDGEELPFDPDNIPGAEWWKRYFGWQIQTLSVRPGAIYSETRLLTVD